MTLFYHRLLLDLRDLAQWEYRWPVLFVAAALLSCGFMARKRNR